jgi:hypothetical protein
MQRASFAHVSAFAFSLATALVSSSARADAVTDWNEFTLAATKGFNGTTGTGVTLNSNLASRVDAIEARAVFDAVNSILHFSKGSYYYTANDSGSARAAAAQAAHDVLLGTLPDPAADSTVDARWSQTRAWLDAQLAEDLGSFGIAASDGGIQAGKAAAAAALSARALDNSAPNTAYGAALVPTSNPGVGLWRQSNAAAPYVSPTTGAPTGFDATGATIQGRPGVDLNWRDVTPFSLTTPQKVALVGNVPQSPLVGSPEYQAELEYVKRIGRDTSSARTPDQTAQALYYKLDAELFVNETARIAALSRGSSLADNAKLFALLDNALADARIAAFTSKYEQKFWRPITALNANADGSVTNGYAAWHPLAATPSHPSNTAGHSATGAAGFEVLRAFFRSDAIKPDGSPATLGTLAWLTGTNSGTGNATSRAVRTFSQAQLENGASRLYLGAHFGFDNLQGQLLGLAVADAIIVHSNDPAARGVRPVESHASFENVTRTLQRQPELYGYFGKESWTGR